jgi:hypothetical protein
VRPEGVEFGGALVNQQRCRGQTTVVVLKKTLLSTVAAWGPLQKQYAVLRKDE